MGYPFDRLIRKKNGEDEADDEKFQSLDEFIQKYSNMAMQSITIKFTDEVQQELETSEAKKDCREPKDQWWIYLVIQSLLVINIVDISVHAELEHVGYKKKCLSKMIW